LMKSNIRQNPGPITVHEFRLCSYYGVKQSHLGIIIGHFLK
jgi:hypothetical protein